jgi:5'-nucleotidase
MHLLITNDDGIHAPGIRALAEQLAGEHEVYVVAPDRERSATGHALTLHKPIRVDEVDMFGATKCYAVSGTPSDCVKIALNALLPFRPDMVLSGINAGPNLGMDVLYSGTVSAALEGAINNLPSVAVSLYNGNDKDANFSHGAKFIATLLREKLPTLKFPTKGILNINIPPVTLAEFTGVTVCDLGTRTYTDFYERRVDPRGNVYYWLAGEVVDRGGAPNTDMEVLRNNQVSITPVSFPLINKTRSIALGKVSTL